MPQPGIDICPKCLGKGIMNINGLMLQPNEIGLHEDTITVPCDYPGCVMGKLDSCSGDAGQRFGQLENDK